MEEEVDEQALKVIRYKCQKSLLFHTRYFFKKNNNRKFVIGQHHEIICKALERVMEGKCKRLIINIAPRYGKTEVAVINLITHALSINSRSKFIHLSYSDDLALDNSERAKQMVMSSDYQALFPHVQINKNSKAKDKWYTTDGGGVLARASKGQVTGFGAGSVDDPEEENRFIDEFLPADSKSDFSGAIIIDDPIKPEEADSDNLREKINSQFDSTIRSRTNSRNTPIILIMQRLHPNDLAGYLQRPEELDEWEVVSLPCLYFDEEGQMQSLWPFRHTVEELLAMKASNELVYERQYNQNPKPKAGLMFPPDELNWFDYSEVEELLDDPDFCYMPVDPANLGGDDFAGIVLKLISNRIYVTEVLYNLEGTDINEVKVRNIAIKEKVHSVGVEGVFGWKETAERIREDLERKTDFEGEFRILRPRTGKHVRISSRQSFIRNHFYFRKDYSTFPEYYKFIQNLTSYLKIQAPGLGNKHDEAPDVCEMGAAYFERNFPEIEWKVIKSP